MGTSVEHYQARRVLTGTDDNGRSQIVADELASPRRATPTFTVVDLWQTNCAPSAILASDTLTEEVSLKPPHGGLLVRIVTFPPDHEWRTGGGYDKAMGSFGGAQSNVVSNDVPGMHTTDTVDVVTVLEGELYAVLENEEVLLRTGDSLVQRGTKLAWSNRTSETATIVATMYSATR